MTIHQIDSTTLKSWQENDEAILIDVREVYENQAERIAGAILIPLGEIDIDKLPILENKKLVIQCRSGKRSFMAAEHLLAQNPGLTIYNLETGIEGWKADGFKILTN